MKSNHGKQEYIARQKSKVRGCDVPPSRYTLLPCARMAVLNSEVAIHKCFSK